MLTKGVELDAAHELTKGVELGAAHELIKGVELDAAHELIKGVELGAAHVKPLMFLIRKVLLKIELAIHTGLYTNNTISYFRGIFHSPMISSFYTP